MWTFQIRKNGLAVEIFNKVYNRFKIVAGTH